MMNIQIPIKVIFNDNIFSDNSHQAQLNYLLYMRIFNEIQLLTIHVYIDKFMKQLSL